MKAWLEEVQPDGKAAQFVAPAGDSGTSFFLQLCGEVKPDEEQLQTGELFAISADTDAEPGDLVVWWTGSNASLALAKMSDDLRLHPVGGFPAPELQCGNGVAREVRGASLRGVVVGRLRRMRPAQ
jgi:hypothetical protein